MIVTYLRGRQFWAKKQVLVVGNLKLLHRMALSYPSKEFKTILLRKCGIFYELVLGQERKYVTIRYGANNHFLAYLGAYVCFEYT